MQYHSQRRNAALAQGLWDPGKALAGEYGDLAGCPLEALKPVGIRRGRPAPGVNTSQRAVTTERSGIRLPARPLGIPPRNPAPRWPMAAHGWPVPQACPVPFLGRWPAGAVPPVDHGGTLSGRWEQGMR